MPFFKGMATKNSMITWKQLPDHIMYTQNNNTVVFLKSFVGRSIRIIEKNPSRIVLFQGITHDFFDKNTADIHIDPASGRVCEGCG
jgi:hypothetical protein